MISGDLQEGWRGFYFISKNPMAAVAAFQSEVSRNGGGATAAADWFKFRWLQKKRPPGAVERVRGGGSFAVVRSDYGCGGGG